jgi:hypothetical protein
MLTDREVLERLLTAAVEEVNHPGAMPRRVLAAACRQAIGHLKFLDEWGRDDIRPVPDA